MDNYVDKATALFDSMKDNGFDRRCPIPIDPNNELLGGAHRLACALALDLSVYVEKKSESVWAPAWGIGWFWKAGMSEKDIHELQYHFERVWRGWVDG